MKKVTKLLMSIVVFGVLFTVYAEAQDSTHVYNDDTLSGIFFQGTDGGEVENPIKDDVNSSQTVAVSATDGNWQQIQYFPTYNSESGDKLLFSVYNPNGAGPGQVQFSYSGSDDWQYGADVTYEAGSDTGWVEYSIDLTEHAGNEIDQIIIMPAGNNSAATYIDNIYFYSESNEPLEPTEKPLYVYNDSTSSGIFFQGTDGGQVVNPVTDDVNSSDTVAVSATDGNWQQIQYFPTYVPESGDKLFFSVHNPNGAGPGQVQFSYSGSDDWQYGADVTYEAGSETGWMEYSVDLTEHAGNEIDQIIIMPAGNNSSATYIDNIYFSDESELTVPLEPTEKPLYVYNDTTSSGIFFQGTDGGQVVNPVTDDVNSSDTVAVSATDGNWQQIQYFPTFVPESGDKLFFSVHNPNGAGPGQVQFSYTGSDDWQYGADITYDAGSETGWVEYSVDLTDHLGNEIDQVIIMPAGDNSAATYIDNVYFSDSTEIATPTEPIEPTEKPLHVYNDTTSSGIFFQGTDGGEVANPVSDDVNSSDTVAVSATDGNWQQIQYFPTYVPESGDKLFFSVHNPNGAGPGQVQFSYTGSDEWEWGDNVDYETDSETGWVEYSVDLTDHAGNEIDQVIIMPAGDNSAATYIDNIYFSDSTELAVSTESNGDVVENFKLNQNYPNPFNPTTNIGFNLPNTVNVTLKVYNLLGQEVATIIDGAKMNSGVHSVSFDAGSLSSGVYFYRIEAGNFNSTKRMMLIK